MANRFSTLLATVAATALLTAGAAQAQTTRTAPRPQATRAHHPVVIAEMSDAMAARPLVIQKRSFLDPGNTVGVGEDTPANIVFNTTEHVPIYQTFRPAFFGESELPGRFDLPPTNPRFETSSQPQIPLPFDE